MTLWSRTTSRRTPDRDGPVVRVVPGYAAGLPGAVSVVSSWPAMVWPAIGARLRMIWLTSSAVCASAGVDRALSRVTHRPKVDIRNMAVLLLLLGVTYDRHGGGRGG